LSKTYLTKLVFGSALLLSLTASAAADVPEVVVTPQNFADNLSANQEHKTEFEFYNNDSEQKVINFSISDSEHIDWEENHFNISAGATRTVNATIFKKREGRFNQSFDPIYYYEGADNSFDAPRIRFNVSTYYRNTSIALEAFEDSFTAKLGEQVSSVFKINNSGTETGFNISVEREGNVTFDTRDGFDLKDGESRIVKFNVTVPVPETNRTAATNQTYNYNISVSGENFERKEFGVDVFVPFKQYNTTVQGQTIAERWLELEKKRLDYCRSVEFESAICKDQFTVTKNNTEYINRTPESNLTLTQPEVKALKELSNTTGVGYDRIVERVKKLQNTIRYQQSQTSENLTRIAERQNEQISENREMIQGLNSTLRRSLQQDRRQQQNRSFWSNVRGAFFALVILSLGGWKAYKIQSKRSSDSRV